MVYLTFILWNFMISFSTNKNEFLNAFTEMNEKIRRRFRNEMSPSKSFMWQYETQMGLHCHLTCKGLSHKVDSCNVEVKHKLQKSKSNTKMTCHQNCSIFKQILTMNWTILCSWSCLLIVESGHFGAKLVHKMWFWCCMIDRVLWTCIIGFI